MCDPGERPLKKSCHLNDRGDRSLWTHTEFLRVRMQSILIDYI